MANHPDLGAGLGFLDCGGKRSATPLWPARKFHELSEAARPRESAVVAALCRRSPKTPPGQDCCELNGAEVFRAVQSSSNAKVLHSAGVSSTLRKFIGCQPAATGFTINVTLPAGKSSVPSRLTRWNLV